MTRRDLQRNDTELSGDEGGEQSWGVRAIDTIRSLAPQGSVADEDEDSCRGRVRKVLERSWFQACMMGVIVANAVCIVWTAGLEGREGGTDVEIAEGLNTGFLVVYTIELFVRVYVVRCEAFIQGYTLLDTLIVLVGWIDFFFGAMSLGFLRVFRILRLMRLLRLMELIPSLYFMVRGLPSCLAAMFWGVLLAGLMLLAFAIVAVQVLRPIVDEMEVDQLDAGCRDSFQSIPGAMLYFFATNVQGDSWSRCAVPLIYMNPYLAGLFIIVSMVLQLGLMNLVLSVIVEVARVAAEDDTMHRSKELLDKKKDMVRSLRSLLRRMDTDKDKHISEQEFLDAYRNEPQLRTIMTILDVEEQNLAEIFKAIDQNNSKSIEKKEFLEFIRKTHFTDMKMQVTSMKLELSKMNRDVERRLDSLAEVSAGVQKTAAGIQKTVAALMKDRAPSSLSEAVCDLRSELRDVEGRLGETLQGIAGKRHEDEQLARLLEHTLQAPLARAELDAAERQGRLLEAVRGVAERLSALESKVCCEQGFEQQASSYHGLEQDGMSHPPTPALQSQPPQAWPGSPSHIDAGPLRARPQLFGARPTDLSQIHANEFHPLSQPVLADQRLEDWQRLLLGSPASGAPAPAPRTLPTLLEWAGAAEAAPGAAEAACGREPLLSPPLTGRKAEQPLAGLAGGGLAAAAPPPAAAVPAPWWAPPEGRIERCQGRPEKFQVDPFSHSRVQAALALVVGIGKSSAPREEIWKFVERSGVTLNLFEQHVVQSLLPPGIMDLE